MIKPFNSNFGFNFFNNVLNLLADTADIDAQCASADFH